MVLDISLVLIVLGAIHSKNAKKLKSSCSKCSRNESMMVSDDFVEAESLKYFYKNFSKAAEKKANNPVRASEIVSVIGTSVASRILIEFYHKHPD